MATMADSPMARLEIAAFLCACLVRLALDTRPGLVVLLLQLLGACGGVLALLSDNLGWVVVGLFMSAPWQARLPNTRVGNHARRPTSASWLGLATLLYAMSLMLMAFGTADYAQVSARLRAIGGPLPGAVGVVAALAIAGVLLACDMSLHRPNALRQSLPATVLGAGILMRLCNVAFGSLSSGWSLALAAVGCAQLLLGGLRAHTTRSREVRYAYLDWAQRGWLLVAIGLSARQTGQVASLSALVAYTLANVVLTLLRPDWACVPDAGSPSNCPSRRRWTRAPAVIALLSLAGAPGTLGLVARAQTMWAAEESGMSWLAVVGVSAWALVAASYALQVPDVCSGRDERLGADLHSRWHMLFATVAALTLVFLGLWPMPLLRLSTG